MNRAAFPALAVACRALGLTADQTTEVLEAAAADGEAIQRIGQTELDAAWKEGFEAAHESVDQALAEQVENDKILTAKEKRLDAKRENLGENIAIQVGNDKILGEKLRNLANERADLDRRRAELEDPLARRCDNTRCDKPMPAHKRSDSRYCSPRCRQAAFHARAVTR